MAFPGRAPLDRESDSRLAAPDLGFVICVESGVLERQAMLLCASIRRYGGRFASCPVYAVSPRPSQRPAAGVRREFAALAVEYLEESLNVALSDVPMISNKPLAAGFVEACTSHELLVVLDTDTLMLGEPEELLLRPDEDVAVRPADARGVSTTGLPGDAFDDYWRRLCAALGVAYEGIPLGRTFVDQVEVKAYYQTGCVCVRRDRGIFQAWARYVTSSFALGIGPGLDGRPRRGSVGYLTGHEAEWWGADIPALTLAIWGATDRVRLLSVGYNYPLHLHSRVDPRARINHATALTSVHYHWMFNAQHLDENPLLGSAFGLPSDVLPWLRDYLPIDVDGAP